MKILPFFIFCLVFILLLRFAFVFKQINCSLEQMSLESGVCEQINQHFKGKSLFFTDLENDPFWDDLLADQNYSQVYQYASIKKSLSGQADLLLLAKLPDYRLVVGQEKYLLNQNNKLKNDQTSLVLPSIEFIGDLSLENGYLDEAYHHKFLSLALALNEHQIKTEKIVWQSDQEIHLFLPEIEVLLDDQKDFAYQIERLAVILKQEESRALLLEKRLLDMRFNLPVLKDF